MSSEHVIFIIAAFCGSSDVLTREEALDMLTTDPGVQKEREEKMLKDGYPAYTTAAGRKLRRRNSMILSVSEE